MAVVVAVLAVLVVVAGAVAGAQYAAARRHRARADAAEVRIADSEAEAGTARAEAEAARDEAAEASAAQAVASAAAAGRDRDIQNLEARLQTATSRAEVAERRTGEVEARLAGLTAAPSPTELAAAPPISNELAVDTGLANPDLLWALEVVRTARTWRYSVAVGPDEGSPFGTGDDPLRVAIEVEAAALREESGAEIDIDWDLPMRLDTSRSLIVLRAAQETLAAAARLADTVVLGVLADGGDVVLTLRGPEADDPAVDLPADALPAADGFERLPDGVRVLGAAIPAYEG
jgi:hypothetical protein